MADDEPEQAGEDGEQLADVGAGRREAPEGGLAVLSEQGEGLLQRA